MWVFIKSICIHFDHSLMWMMTAALLQSWAKFKNDQMYKNQCPGIDLWDFVISNCGDIATSLRELSWTGNKGFGVGKQWRGGRHRENWVSDGWRLIDWEIGKSSEAWRRRIVNKSCSGIENNFRNRMQNCVVDVNRMEIFQYKGHYQCIFIKGNARIFTI